MARIKIFDPLNPVAPLTLNTLNNIFHESVAPPVASGCPLTPQSATT